MKQNIKTAARQYIKMAVQNLFLPVAYQLMKPAHIQKGLIVFADAHNHTVPSSMQPPYCGKSNGAALCRW